MPLLDPPTQHWIVQKYGGTSLGKLLPTITGSIIPQYLQSNRVAIVCSAISGVSKTQGTTSLLLSAIDSATNPVAPPSQLEEIVGIIRDEHLSLAGTLDLKGEVEVGVRKDCKSIVEFLRAAQVNCLCNPLEIRGG
jgi:aspartate kinase